VRFTAFLVCLWAWPVSSLPCSCPDDPSPLEQSVQDAVSSASYVAIIEVKSTQPESVTHEVHFSEWNPRTLESESRSKMVTFHQLVAEFNALRIYKGDASFTQVETPADPKDCGITLERGVRYLVYAFGPGENNRISTSRCSRTALAESSADEQAILSSLTKPVSVVYQPPESERRFTEALDLIHLSIEEPDTEGISRAMAISEQLARSDPFSGYSQALQAELRSTWELADNRQPVEMQQEILKLTDEALRINPKLAQAHVARARTHMRASRLSDAQAEIQAAFRLAPRILTGIFVQAEIYRRANDSARAEKWMIDYMVATKDPVQKANGYQWLGDMRRDIAYHPEAVNREMNLLLAKATYLSSTQLDPGDARRYVTLAAFLNEYVADFAAAESNAAKAIAIEDSELAHYHLAAARYQALQARGTEIDADKLRSSIAEIGAATGVSLDQAVEFWGFHDVTRVRLIRLQLKSGATAR